MLSVLQMILESDGMMEEEGWREVGCQWESPEEEVKKEVGCQWESPEEEMKKEVGCQWESPEEEMKKEVGCQWESPEEEMKKEVGCQWESPGEEVKKKVGCQMDSPKRRDAAVQVDLLTQQLHGVVWRCVSVRANDPGGGALLHHCCGQRPAAPLDPEESETKHLQQTASLPSMHLCEQPPLPLALDTSAAPPPGLIAPLSPRLAEEEEEEEEDSSFKHEISKCVHVTIQSTSKAEEKKERRKGKPGQNKPRGAGVKPRSSTSIPHQRKSRRRKDEKKTLSHSERRKIRVKNQRVVRRRIQKGRPEERLKRTKRRGEVEGGVKAVRIKPEPKERPRRKAVGPPIRYLLEYEEMSHGLSAANHNKDKERVEEEPERRGGEKSDSRLVDYSVGGARQLSQLPLSVHRGRRFSRKPALLLHLRHHYRHTGSRQGNRAAAAGVRGAYDRPEVHTNEKKEEEVIIKSKVKEKKTLLLAPTKAPDWTRHRRRAHRNPSWWMDYSFTKRKDSPLVSYQLGSEGQQHHLVAANLERAKEVEDDEAEEKQTGEVKTEEHQKTTREGPKGRQKKEKEENQTREEGRMQAWRPRRTMVGPPIRYLLESEEQPRGLLTANQERAEESGSPRKPETKIKGEGGASDKTAVIDRPNPKPGTKGNDGQKTLTNQVAEVRPKHRVGRHRKVVIENVTRGGASKMDHQPTETMVEQTKKRLREEEEGLHSEEEVQEPRRSRRTMVGPPVRYLLESEEQLHRLVTANQERAQASQLTSKPRKKRAGTELKHDKEEICSYLDSSHLIDIDPQSRQMSVFSPCWVRLQRLV